MEHASAIPSWFKGGSGESPRIWPKHKFCASNWAVCSTASRHAGLSPGAPQDAAVQHIRESGKQTVESR